MEAMKTDCANYEKFEQLARLVPGLDQEAVASCIPLFLLLRQLDSAIDNHFQAHGLSYGRWQVLIQLYKGDERGLTPAELADYSAVTRAGITGLVDTLAAAGLVSRGGAGDDRRTYRVQLTDAGRAFVNRVLPDHLRRMQQLMQALTPSEQQQFGALVEKLRARVGVFRHSA
jgi:DNA-binding MarR family transcriptional regulator